MFIDAGLELHYKELGNVLTTSYGLKYKPGDFTKNYKKYDYGYVHVHNHYDIQILYSSLSVNAKNFFFNILFNCNEHFKNNFGKFSSSIRDLRLNPLSSNKPPNKPIFWTGAQFANATGVEFPKTGFPFFLLNKEKDRINDNIYLFSTAFNAQKAEYFLDFPSVSLKDQTNQSYANYRNRPTVTMDL